MRQIDSRDSGKNNLSGWDVAWTQGQKMRHRVAGVRGWQCYPNWAREEEGDVVGQTVALIHICIRRYQRDRQICVQVKGRTGWNRAIDLSNTYTQTASVSAWLVTGEITKEQVLMESRRSRMRLWEGCSGGWVCKGGAIKEREEDQKSMKQSYEEKCGQQELAGCSGGGWFRATPGAVLWTRLLDIPVSTVLPYFFLHRPLFSGTPSSVGHILAGTDIWWGLFSCREEVLS